MRERSRVPRKPRGLGPPMPRRRPNIRLEDIDFKNIELLRKFVTEEGKILSRKHTNLPALFQRRMANAIKRARNMLLMK